MAISAMVAIFNPLKLIKFRTHVQEIDGWSKIALFLLILAVTSVILF